MSVLRILYHLARADFLERVRRYSFLITLGLTLYFSYLTVPPTPAMYVTMQMAGHRGIYNSAYIGTQVALFSSIFLSFAGFYLVKNAVDRDLRTGVGQILATTPLTKSLYTVGKAASNFAVLAVMVGVMALAAGVMQLVRHEDMTIHVWKLLAPFLFLALPVMALVASAAILFETVSWLRGGFGNLAYFFLWMAAITTMGIQTLVGSWWRLDLTGGGAVIPSIFSACGAAYPGCETSKDFSMGFNIGDKLRYLTTFRWEGVDWAPAIVLSRLIWVGLAFGLALLAAKFFHRFDPALATRKETLTPLPEPHGAEASVARPAAFHVSLSRLSPGERRYRIGALVAAELRLALKGLSRWWYVVAFGLIVGEVASPLPLSRGFLIPAWIWPILIWSAMGTREARQGTGQLLFSTAHPIRRQLPACWLAGVAVAAMTGSGVALRLLIARDLPGLAAWTVGALFIPTLALALGVWSGSSKLFEVIYTLLWYAGPASRVPFLDYMGTAGVSGEPRTTRVFLAVTLALAALALAGRKRQLQS